MRTSLIALGALLYGAEAISIPTTTLAQKDSNEIAREFRAADADNNKSLNDEELLTTF